MRNLIALSVALLLAPAVTAQNQGAVNSITATPGPITGNFRFTIRGSNPCTSVNLDFGDGSNNTYTISGLPEDTGNVWHHYTRGGTFTIRATGVGNCRGEASTRVTVNLPADPKPAPPQPAQPATPPAAAVARFPGMDRNGDGVLTRQEWQGSAQSFRFHDWNNDNRLSGDETRVGATPPRRAGFGFGAGSLEWTEDHFRTLDRNRDGGILRAEWRHDAEDFNRVDRDRNGILSLDEFLVGQVDDDRGDRFEDVDADRNNQVDRDEWHGSGEIFRWLDLNGNGALSRGEFEGTETSASPVPGRGRGAGAGRAVGRQPTSGSVEVNARQSWTDSGIDVRAGDTVTISATGTIEWADDRAATAPPTGAGGAATANAPIPRANIGALVARIGDGAPFLALANGGRVRATQNGRLYLGVNDDVLTDNRGAFRAVITVQR